MLQDYFYRFIRKILSVPENKDRKISNPDKILIVRQHNQLGDLLACISVFRALKETYPECKITIIVSLANYTAVTKNKFIDEVLFLIKRNYSPPGIYIIYISCCAGNMILR